jgi:molecular chaperone GrpE
VSDEGARSAAAAAAAAANEETAAANGETRADEPTVQDPDAALAETEDRLRRALADLDNLRKRYQRELARERDAERRRVTAELLPIIDNLERALDHAVGPECAALADGIRVVHEQAIVALSRLGFERFDDIGRPFDPARDEAIGAIDSDAPPGTVVAAVRAGYCAGDELLRPAGVVVSKGAV